MEVKTNKEDYLREDYVGKKFALKDGLIMPLHKRNMALIRTGTVQGYNEVYPGDLVDLAYPTSKTRRARVIKDRICPTITTSKQIGVIMKDLSVRYLTSLEAMLLQGFSERQYNLCRDAGVSENEIYARAGNSIAVPISREIIKAVFNKGDKKNV
jgi:DNA (cytosine-5)-methyltransferase 1